MARIVHMDVLVPDAIDFDMGDGRVFRVNGNLPVQQMLTFAKLESRLEQSQAQAIALRDADDAEGFDAMGESIIATLDELCAEILAVLQVHQPELTECPFDQAQVGVFISALRGQIEEQLGPDPTQPSPESAGKTAPNRATRRSRPSSGSPRSGSSSAGRRTTGAA